MALCFSYFFGAVRAEKYGGPRWMPSVLSLVDRSATPKEGFLSDVGSFSRRGR